MVPSDVLVVLVVEVGVGGEIPSQSLDIFTSAQFLQSENEVCFVNWKSLNDKNECDLLLPELFSCIRDCKWDREEERLNVITSSTKAAITQTVPSTGWLHAGRLPGSKKAGNG